MAKITARIKRNVDAITPAHAMLVHLSSAIMDSPQ